MEHKKKGFSAPESVIRDRENYKKSLREFLSGNMEKERFKGIRVPWGFYTHRGGKKYMARVRVIAQELSPRQLGSLSEAARKYSSVPLHITTRGDIQVHWLSAEDTAGLLDDIARAGLSTRGGGGNSVRNIACCSLAGVCPDEDFDVRPHAAALTEKLLEDEKSYQLPRKYKIAFSGCSKDCSLASFTDLGFIAKKRDTEKGFSLYAAGGMGASSAVGEKIRDFTNEKEALKYARALEMLFFKHGNRKNRRRARLRFLLKEIGIKSFMQLLEEELEKTAEGEAELRVLTGPPELPDEELKIDIDFSEYEFSLFCRHSLFAQKQQGYYYFRLRIVLGDLTHKQAVELSKIEGICPQAVFRTANDQNLYIVNIPAAGVRDVYDVIKKARLDAPYPGSALDVSACQGAATCNVGICNSKALGKELVGELEKSAGELARLGEVRLKINGCPNACAQHPTAPLGLAGMAKKMGMRLVPFYRIFTGGRTGEGRSALAREIAQVPARNVINLLSEFLKSAAEKIGKHEKFGEFMEKTGRELLKDIIPKYTHVPQYKEDKSFYRDFGGSEDFSLAGIGPGECGAGVIDMIESDIESASAALEGGDVRQALHYAARALLVVKGIEPATPRAVVEAFEKEFVKSSLAPEKFSAITARYDSGDISQQYSQSLLKEVKSLYGSMDNNFRFPVKEGAETAAEKKASATGTARLELKGVPCPMNYVKAKLFIEQMDPGAEVEIIVDGGEPVRNVPASLKNDGHIIKKIEKEGSHWKVAVEKKNKGG